eukprot:755259-Hanusia_phi.AAC.8
MKQCGYTSNPTSYCQVKAMKASRRITPSVTDAQMMIGVRFSSADRSDRRARHARFEVRLSESPGVVGGAGGLRRGPHHLAAATDRFQPFFNSRWRLEARRLWGIEWVVTWHRGGGVVTVRKGPAGMAGRAESGTQFEAPGSRPTSAEGKILVPKKFIPARSKSTEPRLTVEVAEASLSKSLKSSDLRKGGVPTANTDGENNGEMRSEGCSAVFALISL